MLLFGLHIPSIRLHFRKNFNPKVLPIIYLKNLNNTSISFYSSENVTNS